MEALKLAPDNRELRRLLIRVKEECIEASRLENSGVAESNTLATTQIEKKSPTSADASVSTEKQRKKEETAL